VPERPIEIPDQIARRTDLPPAAKLLFGLMAGVGRKSGLCWMKESVMAERIGVSPRTVRRLLRRLEAAGLASLEISGGGGRPRRGAQPGRAWRLWPEGDGPPAAPATDRPPADADLPDQGGQSVLRFPEKGGQTVPLFEPKGGHSVRGVADTLSEKGGHSVRKDADKMSAPTAERQNRQTPCESEKDENSSADVPRDRSVCSVDGNGHDGHQADGDAANAPDTILARLRGVLASRDGPPAYRAMACLTVAGCTGSQAKTLRDRYGDEAVLAAARYTAHREAVNVGGYIRQCLREGWHAATRH